MNTLKGILASLALAGPVWAQDIDTDAGRGLYLNYCWQCHGRDAMGNGPMAEMLAIETPDLTGLARRNAGVFPLANVAMQIDGRSPMLAHGGEMPIFGPAFEADQNVALSLPSGQPMMTGRPLANILAYLQSVQID